MDPLHHCIMDFNNGIQIPVRDRPSPHFFSLDDEAVAAAGGTSHGSANNVDSIQDSDATFITSNQPYPTKSMDTRAKSNAEFRQDMQEAIARHDNQFAQIAATLQAINVELRVGRIAREQAELQMENPFADERTRNSPQPHDPKARFPKFDGGDPSGWLYQAEQYFEYYDVAPDLQVKLVSMNSEGLALQWFRWLIKRRGLVAWEEFVKALRI
ncbi:unnamed protein product [Cuscuta epithymum]|uniref:Retrotransposon gag domain-containing protein n=1 Tax=Cuscuta epithymum TaxID=186058 RepID=A0AAV0FP00_9ASTE|nr:unnamed protein product [Cuscuta epithymum]